MSSSRGRKGTDRPRAPRKSRHALSVRLVTHTSAASAPASAAFNSPLPMAPQPTMPMVFME